MGGELELMCIHSYKLTYAIEENPELVIDVATAPLGFALTAGPGSTVVRQRVAAPFERA